MESAGVPTTVKHPYGGHVPIPQKGRRAAPMRDTRFASRGVRGISQRTIHGPARAKHSRESVPHVVCRPLARIPGRLAQGRLLARRQVGQRDTPIAFALLKHLPGNHGVASRGESDAQPIHTIALVDFGTHVTRQDRRGRVVGGGQGQIGPSVALGDGAPGHFSEE